MKEQRPTTEVKCIAVGNSGDKNEQVFAFYNNKLTEFCIFWDIVKTLGNFLTLRKFLHWWSRVMRTLFLPKRWEILLVYNFSRKMFSIVRLNKYVANGENCRIYIFILRSSSFLLRYNWHVTLYKFKVNSVLLWFIYILHYDYHHSVTWHCSHVTYLSFLSCGESHYNIISQHLW